MLLPKYH